MLSGVNTKGESASRAIRELLGQVSFLGWKVRDFTDFERS